MRTHFTHTRLVSAGMLVCFVLSAGLMVAHAQETRYFRVVGPGATAITGVTPDGCLIWTNELTNVTCTVQTALSLLTASNWADYVQVPVSNHVVSQRIFDPNPPSGTVFIPSGSLVIGDLFGEGWPWEVPLHTVYVSAFYVDRCEVTKALWDEVYNWALANGYSFDCPGSGKAPNHPVQTLDWYDCLKWCNARAEKEGRIPAYYTDVGLAVRYRSGSVVPYVNWNSGYRLPTEAEWEKAARGGVGGHRFPWSNEDTISQGQANYYGYPVSSGGYSYDLSPQQGYHPTFNDGVYPYTSPVGYFAANGYGLYDVAGNVWEWCWDWVGTYSSDPQTDPRGPATGMSRVVRGGGWNDNARGCRTADRNGDLPANWSSATGFRCALSTGQ